MSHFKKISGPKITIGFGSSSFSYRGEPKKPSTEHPLSLPNNISLRDHSPAPQQKMASPEDDPSEPSKNPPAFLAEAGEDDLMFNLEL